MLEKGDQVQLQDDYEDTTLTYASSSGLADAIQLFLDSDQHILEHLYFCGISRWGYHITILNIVLTIYAQLFFPFILLLTDMMYFRILD